MTNMTINHREFSALHGLPFLQQLLYLRALRPYIDYKTGIVGIKRGISYQSLAEELYIEPHPGIQSGSPHKEQIRRALKGLERVGLIAIQSREWKLVVHCLLVVGHFSEQNKPDTNPTQHPNLNQLIDKPLLSTNNTDCDTRANREKIEKPDIPLKSVNNNLCVYARFEKFWALYPTKTGKQKAWEIFQELQPADDLLNQMLVALQEQIELYNALQHRGVWTPKWKFPANWLVQHAWEDELDRSLLEKHQHANTDTNHKQSSTDFFWESCKAGAWLENKQRETKHADT